MSPNSTWDKIFEFGNEEKQSKTPNKVTIRGDGFTEGERAE